MADAVSGAAGKVAMKMFGPHPSITIVTFWQGIVEIALRAIGVVVAFVCLIVAAVTLDDLDFTRGFFGRRLDDTADSAESACGFLIFLAIMVMLIEGIIIALRFLNFGIVNKFIFIFHIVDIVISVVFAILFFCLAIATAVYGGRFGNDYNGFRDLDSDLAAVAFFCFVGLFLFAGLAAFMGVSIMLKWRNTQASYASAPGALGG